MEAFDWVKARAECSLDSVFTFLAEVVDNDVRAANKLQRRGALFAISRAAGGKIIVLRTRDLGGFSERLSVVFALTESAITARRVNADGAGDLIFSATPSLNREGGCLLDIDGQSLKLWQVSRLALEDLFFGF